MKKTNAHRTVHLHIYMGKHGIKGIAKGENGKVVNDNHLVKLAYGSFSWDNYMKNLQASGIIKVDVVGFLKKDYKEGPFTYDEAKGVQAEVDTAMTVQAEVKLTPDQKRLAELEAKYNALIEEQAGNSEEKPEEEEAPAQEGNDSRSGNDAEAEAALEAVRAKYTEVFGKPPHHMKQLKGLTEAIDEELERQKAEKEAAANEGGGEGENQNTGTPAEGEGNESGTEGKGSE